jgi:predicted RNase H-like HicB family nuclease
MARFEVIGRKPPFDDVMDEVESTKEAFELIRELKKINWETDAGYVAFFLRPKGFSGIPGVAA